MRERTFEKLLAKYDYRLPKSRIAQEPARPRDASRLLVSSPSGDEVRYDTFRHLYRYLPPRSLLIFNETKVIPARFIARKETGGLLKLLYLDHDAHRIRALSPKSLRVGSRVFLGKKSLQVTKKDSGIYTFIPDFPPAKIAAYLTRRGEVPLPPYISRSSLTRRAIRKSYQSVFARDGESVAAPTASLHFTHRLMRRLKSEGHQIAFLSLRVGLGTFAPVTEAQLERGKLHKEEYAVPKRTYHMILRAKKDGRPVIAVGTTVVRALESVWNGKGSHRKLKGATELFIGEGYRFRVIDGIVTNFHVPRSSLLMLISAFVGRKRLFLLYRRAIHRKFRFFSFGDGMFIRPQDFS